MHDWIAAVTGLLPDWLAANLEWKQVVLIAMTPIFLLAFGAEWRFMAQRGRAQSFSLPDIMANLNLGLAYQVFELIAYTLVTASLVGWFWQHRLFDMPITVWTVPLLFVFMEFCYYWFHRASHRIRWFWAAHVVHHSEERMNMTTAMRQSLLYSVTGWWLFFMPMVLLGVPPEVVFVLYACDLTWQFFIHTESIGKLPAWMEYWLNTPSNHRVHHARNPEYIDRNYGGVLIIFDRWFGTYAEESAPVDYGIVRQVRSRNLLVLNFHEFIDMWRDVARPGPLWLRLQHLWRAPEWVRPDPSTDVAPASRAESQTR